MASGPPAALASPTFVVFRVGAWRCALPLGAVREVVVPAQLSRVPRAPRSIPGVMNLRGRVVTVVDLGVLLGGEPVCDGGQRVLMLDGRKDVGVLVSQVHSIVSLGPETPVPEGAPPAVMAAREWEGGPVLILDLGRCEERLLAQMAAA